MCSKTCNLGFLLNNITCFRLVDGMRDGAVDDQFCDDFGVARPPAAEECSFDRCPRWVIETEYTPVSFVFLVLTFTPSVTYLMHF